MRRGEFPGESLLQSRPKGTKWNPGILASPGFPASASHLISVYRRSYHVESIRPCPGVEIEPELKTSLQVKTTPCISVVFRLGHSQDTMPAFHKSHLRSRIWETFPRTALNHLCLVAGWIGGFPGTLKWERPPRDLRAMGQRKPYNKILSARGSNHVWDGQCIFWLKNHGILG